MLDFLERLEPYTSYRYVLGLVLGGLTLYFVVTSLASLRQLGALLRDLNSLASQGRILDEARLAVDPNCDLKALPTLKSKPGRAVRLLLLLAVLRVLSPRSLARLWPELLAVAVLAALSLWAYVYVFTLGV
ncbi:MAG: hypothetical protein HS108_11865 [Planctomycetes bacterium]|jgi:hypothetical protein|nr:hypothetical protein [Planctomycetota bacterium]MCL4729744.1 hypothetical protein [Planctomycetota bacterium]